MTRIGVILRCGAFPVEARVMQRNDLRLRGPLRFDAASSSSFSFTAQRRATSDDHT